MSPKTPPRRSIRSNGSSPSNGTAGVDNKSPGIPKDYTQPESNIRPSREPEGDDELEYITNQKVAAESPTTSQEAAYNRTNEKQHHGRDITPLSDDEKANRPRQPRAKKRLKRYSPGPEGIRKNKDHAGGAPLIKSPRTRKEKKSISEDLAKIMAGKKPVEEKIADVIADAVANPQGTPSGNTRSKKLQINLRVTKGPPKVRLNIPQNRNDDADDEASGKSAAAPKKSKPAAKCKKGKKTKQTSPAPAATKPGRSKRKTRSRKGRSESPKTTPPTPKEPRKKTKSKTTGKGKGKRAEPKTKEPTKERNNNKAEPKKKEPAKPKPAKKSEPKNKQPAKGKTTKKPTKKTEPKKVPARKKTTKRAKKDARKVKAPTKEAAKL